MTTQQKMLVAIVFIFTNSFSYYSSESTQVPESQCYASEWAPEITPSPSAGRFEEKDFVFNRGMQTVINGNGILSYIYLNRSQSKPSYVFKHTRVVECSKDKKFTEIATLGALEKVQRSTRYGSKPSLERFEKFAKMNNAICCSDIEQKLNYYDKLEDVGAIIYGTQDTSDCALFKEYLAEQKRLQEEVAQNTAE